MKIERLGIEAVREEAGGERRPRQDADSAVAGERQDLALGIAVQQAVLVLQRRHGSDGEGALDICGGMVRDAAVPDLAFVDQPLYLAPRLLDRDAAIDVVQLDEVET